MYQDIKFQLVNSKTVNAFTTGGHFVYIYNALFQMCKTEDELAAVMSHEYAHIYCRHVQKGTGRQQALAALTAAAGAGAQYAAGKSSGGSSAYAQYAAAAAQTGGTLLEDGYSREDEAQADEFGFKFYVRAGWPPEHFADFFKDMIAAGYDTTPELVSNHPTLAHRVQNVQKWVQQLKPGQYQPQPEIASPQQFAQYKQAALQSSQGMPDDQKVLAAKNLLTALPRSCWVPAPQPDQKQAQEQIIEAAKQQQAQQPPPAKGG
jgi:predicted Zn-dependent protease